MFLGVADDEVELAELLDHGRDVPPHLGGEDDEDLAERGTRGATAANRLVFRLLLIWAVVIAAMTLYGWTQ